jgi:iron complex transport system permease protein
VNRHRDVKGLALLVGLAGLLVVAAVASLALGAFEIPPRSVVGILFDRAGIDLGLPFTPAQDAVLWQIRLPRTILGVLVGGALGIAGACLQSAFRNPLAEPAVIGVSSGAAVGAVGAIVLGTTFLGTRTIPALAFVGALVAVLVVYLAARSYGRTEVVTLILTGVAVSVIASAATGLLTYLADDEELRGIVFWTLGSLAGATWSTVGAVAPIIAVGVIGLACCARPLNLLTLGDREAAHLGVHVDRVRLVVIVLSALVTGAAVAVAGIVGFVGLVVPHLIRLIVGPDNRVLLPGSVLGGAALVLLADLLARNLVVPEELPLGVVTALIGGPFFLWLIRRTRRDHGAWA